MDAVVDRHPQRRRARELVEQREEVRAGLLVLPRAREEHGHRDLVDERRRVVAIVLRRIVELDLTRDGDVVDVLIVQELVLVAHLVAGIDLGLLPALAERLGLRDHLGDPLGREAIVEDAARQHRRRRVTDHRHRGDRREVGWLHARDEQLGDARVRQADHPDLVVHDPRLRRDGLDHVVAVEQLHRLEVVERAARAPRAADVHAHRGVAEQAGDQRGWIRRRVAQDRQGAAQPSEGLVDRHRARSRFVVARIGDDGRIRPHVGGARQGDECRQGRAVARRDVLVARDERLARVEPGVGRR